EPSDDDRRLPQDGHPCRQRGQGLGSHVAVKIRVALLAAVLALSACEGAPRQAAPASPKPVPKPTPTLAQAIAHATDLGLAGAGTTVSLNFALKTSLEDATKVQVAVDAVRAAGLEAQWRAPSSLTTADGPAPP